MENNEDLQVNSGESAVQGSSDQLTPSDLEEYVSGFWSEDEVEITAEPEEPENLEGMPAAADMEQETSRVESPYELPRQSRADAQISAPDEDWGETGDSRKIRRKPFWKRSRFWKKVGVLTGLLAVIAGSCGMTAHILNTQWERELQKLENSFESQFSFLEEQVRNSSSAGTGQSVSGTVSLTGGITAAQVYAQNVDSVVMIESTVVSEYYGQSSTGVSAGSGFVLTSDGYVVTNYHVIEGANAVAVILVDGRKFSAAVVGYDSTNDVAVLKIEATGLNPVSLGSSDDLIVGDQVVAIGNPLGSLTSTLTVGYVSAKGRSVSTDGIYINMIQTDAAINSGNSGGPLFNMKGEVIGITTAKYSGQSSSGASIEGIGFAIPISDVADGIQQLITNGYIRSAYMGVVVQNMDESVASIYSLPVGVYVVSVETGGPAAEAGIRAKDIILAVDDTPVQNLTDLTLVLRQYEPGDEAMITIYRAGAEYTVRVVFVQRPSDAG